MNIIPLSEGSFTIDTSKIFVPFDETKDDLQQRNKGSLLVEVQPFVIITSNDIILIDTGLGFSIEGELQIYRNLKANNIDPSSITKVLVSHLHKDHSGGINTVDRLGHSRLTFPLANYYVQHHELDYALDTGFPSYMIDELRELINNPKVVLLNGNGVIDGCIKYQVTSAHSKYHQVFWIEEKGEIIFFGGDDAPQHQQMKNKFIAKYDYDGKKCMELRQQWWKQGQEEAWKFLFYHDIKTPVWHSSIIQR
jgi:glyoxylase-like metal-dependent hydrolase (beta-lactamase superfamily II)